MNKSDNIPINVMGREIEILHTDPSTLLDMMDDPENFPDETLIAFIEREEEKIIFRGTVKLLYLRKSLRDQIENHEPQ